MNVWKPLAICSTSALLLVLGHEVAAAAAPVDPEPGSVAGEYRRLHSALDSLGGARDHLMNAEHNHGGWRERAVEATDHAIHETEEALHWHDPSRTHPGCRATRSRGVRGRVLRRAPPAAERAAPARAGQRSNT